NGGSRAILASSNYCNYMFELIGSRFMSLYRVVLSALLLVLVISSACAEDLRCRNPDLEVGCSEGKCSAAKAGEFTPMDLVFGSDGWVSACAYAGCWEGQGEVKSDSRYLIIIARDLPFSTSPEDVSVHSNVVLIWDRSDEIGMLKMAS